MKQIRKESEAWNELAARVARLPVGANTFLCWFTEEHYEVGGTHAVFQRRVAEDTRRRMTARIHLNLQRGAVAFNGVNNSSEEGRELRVLVCQFFAEEAAADGR